MFELSLNQIMKHMGTNLILENLNFSAYENDRVGLIGPNGCGKSTILKMIAGIEPLNVYPGSWSPGYDYGWISKPRDARVAYLDQMPSYEKDYSVTEVLNLAFENIYSIEVQMRTLEKEMATATEESLEKTLNKYSRLVNEYEALGGYETKEKFAKICTGLKFDEEFLNRPFNKLSGGEKTTVELGKILIDNPDILLLDEPTNHLDTESIEWLEDYLKHYNGIVIVVSHDRYFLDHVANKIVEIEDMKAETYNGNYSKYKFLKEERMRIQYENYKEQKKQIAAMEKTIRDLRQWASQSDNNKFYQRAASIQIKLDKMVRIKRPIFEKRNMQLDLTHVSRSGKETIVGQSITKSFGQTTLIESSDLLIRYGERVALLGPNGSGKTTLLRMLLDEEKLDGGELKLGASVNVAYLPQKIEFAHEEMTVLECFRDDVYILEGKAREYLSKFMFYGKSVYTQVKALSGGERIRLKLAKLLFENVNLLILDEPTNHLDIESIETLESALEDFEGTIFFISHDRYFINKMAERIIAIENKRLISYDCDYKTYRKNQIIEEVVTPIKKEKTTRKKEVSQSELIEKLEKAIEGLENSLESLNQQMSEETDYVELGLLYEEKEKTEQELNSLLNQWTKLNEKEA